MALRQNWRRDTTWARERPVQSPREVSAVSQFFATRQARSTGTLVNNKEMTSKDKKISYPRVCSKMKMAKSWEFLTCDGVLPTRGDRMLTRCFESW